MAAEESNALVSNYCIRDGDAYRILVGRPEGKRPFGRPRRRWMDNSKWIFRKGDGGMDWINLAQDKDSLRAVVNAVMSLFIICREFLV